MRFREDILEHSPCVCKDTAPVPGKQPPSHLIAACLSVDVELVKAVTDAVTQGGCSETWPIPERCVAAVVVRVHKRSRRVYVPFPYVTDAVAWALSATAIFRTIGAFPGAPSRPELP